MLERGVAAELSKNELHYLIDLGPLQADLRSHPTEETDTWATTS
jgi:hypothetical protein